MPPKPFALSVKIVVLDSRGRCLVLKRSERSKGNPGKWDFPGGKVDRGEKFEEALLREVREETGLAVAIERVVGAAQSESPGKRVAYLILEGRRLGGEFRLSVEHADHAWVEPKDLPAVELCGQFRDFARRYAGESVTGGGEADSFD